MWPFHKDVIKLEVLKLLNDVYDSATDMTAGQLFDRIKKILVYLPDNHLTFSFCGNRLYHDSDREIINVGSNLADPGTVLTELRNDNVAVIAFSGMYKDDNTKKQLLDFREKIDASCALIIDLRGNGGGNSMYSDDLAYYLCGSVTKSANKMYRRNNPDAKKISQYFAHAAYDYQGDQDP